MLKLNYCASGVTLAQSTESLAASLRQRVLLGLQTGQPLGLEPTTVSVSVQASLTELSNLDHAIADEPASAIQVFAPEDGWVTIRLQGYWLAHLDAPDSQGLFWSSPAPAVEAAFVQVWRASQESVSPCP